MKINRNLFCQNFFEENKRNSEAIWQGIHNVIYSKNSNRTNTHSSFRIEGNTISDYQDISEILNIFF